MEPTDFLELIQYKAPAKYVQGICHKQAFVNNIEVPWEEFFSEDGLVALAGPPSTPGGRSWPLRAQLPTKLTVRAQDERCDGLSR